VLVWIVVSSRMLIFFSTVMNHAMLHGLRPERSSRMFRESRLR